MTEVGEFGAVESEDAIRDTIADGTKIGMHVPQIAAVLVLTVQSSVDS